MFEQNEEVNEEQDPPAPVTNKQYEQAETLSVASEKAVTTPLTFKVKLQRKPASPDERVTLFSFTDEDRLDHFDSSQGDEFEREFSDLSKAHSFIRGALETGGFVVADDSPVKLKA